MSVEENEALVRSYYEKAFGQKNVGLIAEIMAPDCINHTSIPTIGQGSVSFEQAVNMYYDAFPDINFTIEDAIAQEDKVVLRMTLRGTHKGEFLGIPPTGKKIEVMGLAIFRVANGKIAEVWGLRDHIGTMLQLGVTHQIA